MRYIALILICVTSCTNKPAYTYKATNTNTGVKYYCDSFTKHGDTLGYINTNNTFVPIRMNTDSVIIETLKDTDNF